MLKKILHINISTGIEYTTSTSTPLHVLTLKKQKKELVLESANQYADFESLKGTLSKQNPIFLIINNEQLLSKKINGILKTKNAVATAFPNLQLEDFYIEILHGTSDTFISICRKKYIDDIINQYQETGFHIIGFSLGNTLVSEITTYTEIQSLLTSNAQLTITNTTISDIQLAKETDTETYNINGLEVISPFLLALAGALKQFTHAETNSQNNFAEHNTVLQQQFLQSRIFTIGLKAGLGFFFIVLLVNFLIFSYYNSSIQNLTSELQINETYKTELISLKDKTSKKGRLVEELSSSSSKVSLYLDEIGASLPRSILLSKISYQPLQQKIKETEEVLVDSNTLTIEGTIVNPNDFSNWVASLEKLDWVHNVSIQNYGNQKRKQIAFELHISIQQ